MELDYLAIGATGFTGALKIAMEPRSVECCDGCNGGDASVVAIYDNGSPIDLWECQGCRCLQKPVGAIDVFPGAKVLTVAGAVVPEEVCGRCCYTRYLGASPSISEAWSASTLIRGEAMDLVAEGIRLAMAQNEIAQLKKQLKAPVLPVLPVLPIEPISLDPFARYVESLTQC